VFFKKKQTVVINKVEKGSNWYLLGSLIAAIVAGLLFVGMIKAIVPSEPVLVAVRALEPGDVVNQETVTTKSMPRAAIPKDALHRKDDTSDYRLAATLAAGDVVRKAHLADFKIPGGTVAARTAILGQEFRAVALPPEATLGLNLQPGDKVDLVGVVDVPALGARGSETVSKVIVQAAPVVYMPTVDPKDSAARETRAVVAVQQEVFTSLVLAVVKGKVVAGINAEGKPSNSPTVTLSDVFGLPKGQ